MLPWHRELSGLFFGVSCSERLVAMHKFAEQARAAAIVMSVEGCHVTECSEQVALMHTRPQSSEQLLACSLQEDPLLRCSQAAVCALERESFSFACCCTSLQTHAGILFSFFPLPCTVWGLVQVGSFPFLCFVFWPTDLSSPPGMMEQVRRAVGRAFSAVSTRKMFKGLRRK